MKTDHDYIDTQRLVGDVQADRLIEQIFTNNEQGSLYALLQLPEHAIRDQKKSLLKDFMITTKAQPIWFDALRVKKGQQVFQRYAQEMMSLLGVLALPYCYAASPGNKALYLSDRMRQAPGKRLLDTASFVIAVMTPASFEENGLGYIHINKVRLIHALSRYHLKKHPEWDVAWGEPINQEDMAGTNLAFSYVILLGLQFSGITLSTKEREDFLFAWRFIGYQLSIVDDLLPASYAEANHLTNVIRKRNCKKTHEGAVLTSELISYYKTMVPASQASLVAAQVRHYLGNEVADAIGLTADPLKDEITDAINALKTFQNIFTIQRPSFHAMMLQHSMMKEKVSSSSTPQLS